MRSSKLAEPWRPRDDLAHLIRSEFVAPEPEKFTRKLLNLIHAEAERHQPGADSHQSAAHQSHETCTAVRSRNYCFCARNLLDQRFNLAGWPLPTEETQNDPDGFFGDSSIDAGLGGQPSNQFVHLAPPSAGLSPDLAWELILSACDTNYKRGAQMIPLFIFITGKVLQ
jgi:hypothetical protein